MSYTYNQIIKSIHRSREGYENGSISSKKKGKVSVEADVLWASFGVDCLKIIFRYWILFPFWSYQLQLIMDQVDCREVYDKNGELLPTPHCALPWEDKYPPYCPRKDARQAVQDIGLAKKISDGFHGLTSAVEHGVDKVRAVATHGVDKVRAVATGAVTKVAKVVKVIPAKIEKKITDEATKVIKTVKVIPAELKKVEGMVEREAKAGIKELAATAIKLETTVPGLQAAAVEQAAVGVAKAGIAAVRESGGVEVLGEAAATARQLEKAVEKGWAGKGGRRQKGGAASSQPSRAYSQDARKVVGRILDIRPAPAKEHAHIWASQMERYKKQMNCCATMRGQLDPGTKDDCDKGFHLKNTPPVSWAANLEEFGWPYTYLYNKDPAATRKVCRQDNLPRDKEALCTSYDPSGIHQGGWGRWLGAWFAETQRKTWSRGRWGLHKFLAVFRPFVHNPLTEDMVLGRFETGKTSILAKLKEISDILKTESKTLSKEDTEKYHKLGIGLRRYLGDLHEVKGKFLTACGGGGCDIKGALFDAVKGTNKKEMGSIQHYWKNRKNKGSEVAPTSFIMDFFITAVKPVSMRPYKTSQFWWEWCTPSDFSGPKAAAITQRFWLRYIITWLMGYIITPLVVIFGGFFVGPLLTTIGYFNRYSIFWLPLVFLIMPIPIVMNVFTQTFELIYYFLVGPSGQRKDSTDCPYAGGLYQLKQNLQNYGPLNLFLCLVPILMRLGETLLATETGPPAVGSIVLFAAPVLIVIRLLLGLWRIVKKWLGR